VPPRAAYSHSASVGSRYFFPGFFGELAREFACKFPGDLFYRVTAAFELGRPRAHDGEPFILSDFEFSDRESFDTYCMSRLRIMLRVLARYAHREPTGRQRNHVRAIGTVLERCGIRKDALRGKR